MKLYKLTDENGMTRAGEHNACQWGEGVTHSGTGIGQLCGPGYIHAYTDPLLAVFLNPIHAAFRSPRLWEAEGTNALSDGQLKCGCVSLTTVRELPLPVVTTDQRIRFALLCALAVYTNPAFVSWANDWLSGKDRSASAADAVANAAYAANAAARAAANAAMNAAYANAAMNAAYAEASAAANAAAYAANAAASAAYAAANAAAYAAYAANAAIDLAAIAREAVS